MRLVKHFLLGVVNPTNIKREHFTPDTEVRQFPTKISGALPIVLIDMPSTGLSLEIYASYFTIDTSFLVGQHAQIFV